MFSLNLLKRELKTASNIKDRKNKSNVERGLKIIIEKIKNLKQNDNKNGLIIFAGIYIYKQELLEIIIPIIPSNLSYYRCDNKFHTWIIENLFEKNNESILLVLIYGDYYGIFECHSTYTTKIYEQSILLVKRHNKGGSSSGRFSRIAEESRLNYTNIVADKIHKILISTKIPVVIDGGRELVENLRQIIYKNEGKNPKVLDYFHEYKQGILQQNKIFINSIISDIYNNNEEMIKNILDNFFYKSDIFLIGMNEIKENYDSIETLIYIQEKQNDMITMEKNCIKIPINSKFYITLKNLGGIIAKKYY